MSLSATIALKKDDGTSEDYVTVDQSPSSAGTLRRNTAIDAPESQSLLIRSTDLGKGSSKATRHSQSLSKTVADANGVLYNGTVGISIVQPSNPVFTPQMVIDMLHQLLDLYVSTSTFDVDDAVVKQILRGES